MDTDEPPRYFVKWFPPGTDGPFTGDFFAVIDGQEAVEVDRFPVIGNDRGTEGAKADALARSRELNADALTERNAQ